MKIRTIFLLLLIGTGPLQSYSYGQTTAGNSKATNEPRQQNMQTLFGNDDKKIDHGGWGGFTLGYTTIAGKSAFLSGGRGGWLLDHSFTLGFAGYGFISNMDFAGNYVPTADNYALGGGYGGLLLEPIFAPFAPVHISVPILIGGGGAYVLDDMGYHGYDNFGTFGGCFVIEAGVDLELNIVKFFRIAFNVGYRYATDLDLNYYSIVSSEEFSIASDALRGFNAGLTMKFGKF